MLRFQSQVCLIHSYLSNFPVVKGLVHDRDAKIFRHRPRKPTWTKSLHKIDCGLVPYGDHLRHCFYYINDMQPSARYFPPCWGRPENR